MKGVTFMLTAVLLLAVSRVGLCEARGWLTRYAVDAACPGEQEFRARVGARLNEGRSLSNVSLSVAIRRDAEQIRGRFVGRSELTESSRTTTRIVSANSCSEVVEALSLIAALSARRPVPSPQLQTPPGSAPTVTPAPDRPQSASAPSEAHGSAIGAVVLGFVQSGMVPRTALGLGLGLAIELPLLGGESRFQLAGYRVRSGPIAGAAPAVTAQFEQIGVSALACPDVLGPLGAATLRPCADLDVGRLSGVGAGAGLLPAGKKSGLWLSPGLSLRAEVALAGPVRFAFSSGGFVPLVRHEFFFAPGTAVFRVPALGWRLGASVSALF